MKKIYIIRILIGVASIIACGFLGTAMGFLGAVASGGQVKSKEGFIYRVYVIDKCEYISYDRGISHKGNCTNLFHKISK